uniref:Uncharacterized protein n=1 Tax=Ascaris lumbricoides TaxID=6252 RepID=A0A9J2Q1N1_ASCLU
MMSSGMKTEPSRGSLLMSHAELIAPLTNNPKRRILRGRKIISLEQVIEEMKADICISAESSNNSESLKNANEINGWKIERQELLRRRAAIREQQQLVYTMFSETHNDDESENVDPLLVSIESTEMNYEGFASIPLQIHSQVRQGFDPQQYIGGKEVETQLISGGHKNSAMIGRELTKAHALQEVGCNSAAMNLEAARRGFGNKEARRRSKVDAGTKGVTGELRTIATNNKVVQETTSEVPAMLEDEEEPMEIDSTLTEAERSRRKSAMPIELLRRKDGSTRSSSDHFMHRQEEANRVPVKESEAYQHVRTEKAYANKKEQMAHMADLVVGTKTDFGLSRRWVNIKSRKSYAYGQYSDGNDRKHPTAAGRYSTGPFKLAGSDVKDLPKEVVKAIEETELENMHNIGHHNATFTVTDPKARNIAQQMMSEEEIAARALIGLSEAANKEAYLASIPAGDASSTLGKVNASQLNDRTNNTASASTSAQRYLMEFFCYLQEVTIITRAMELDESSALKQAPKSRWDDTTITENQGKARMISDHSELGGSTFEGGNGVAPAPFRESFEESSIAKSSTGIARNESSLSAMNATRSMRDELLNILDVTYGGHPIVPKTNRTLLSFKTPKKTAAIPSMKTRTQNVTSCKSASKQTRSAKQGRISGRVTSTPNEVEAHVCPRFAAHQAASTTPKRASDQNKTLSPSSASRMVRIGPGTRILHSPVVNVAHEDASSPFRIPSLPIARVQRPSLALSQIADYKSPSYTPKRSTHSPIIRNTTDERKSSSSSLRAPLISPRPASRSSRIPAPINDLAKVNDESGIATKVQEYLRSGGTPRPNTHTENVFTRSMSFARRDSVVKSGPRTPTVSFDVSRMVVGNVAASGPVSRRQPLNRGSSRLALPSLAKLNFDEGADSDEEHNTKQASKTVVTEQPASTDEIGMHEEGDQNSTRKVMIDSDESGDYGVGALESDTSRLSIHDSIDDQRVDISDKTGGAIKQTRQSIRTKLLDLSIATLDSPKIEEDWSVMSRLQEAVRQRASLASTCSSTHSDEPLHVVAARSRQEPVAAYLSKRKIVHPNNEQGEGVRRSARNRVAPTRRWLGEVPVYRIDAQGNRELVDISTAPIRDPFLLKYGTPSMEVAFERYRQAQRLHTHSRYLLRTVKVARKQERVKELNEKHKRCEDLDVSVTDIKTSSDEDDDELT